MNWSVKLGKIVVMFVVNILARNPYAPCHRCLKTALRVFEYLKCHPKGAIQFATQISEDIEDKKLSKGWKHLYPPTKEKYSKRYTPTPKGKRLKIIVEMDADHAHDLETRRSVTGILLYLNGIDQSW